MKGRSATRHPKGRLFVIALGLTQGLVYGDTAAFGTALTTIARDLSLSHSSAIWILNTFIIAFGAFVGVAGRMVECTSAQRVLGLGVVVFAIGSVAGAALPTGWAPVEPWLITCRALQGIGGALITPAAIVMVLEDVPDDQRGRVVSLFTGSGVILFAAAPLVGGLLAQFLSWRMVFMATALISPIALWAMHKSPTSPEQTLRADLTTIGRLFWMGAWLALGLGGCIGSLGMLAQTGASERAVNPGWFLWGGSLVILAFGLWRDQRQTHPVLPLSLFARPSFTIRTILFALIASFLPAVLVFGAHAMQLVLAMSPSQAGLCMLALVATRLLAARPAGQLYDRVSHLLPIAIGVPLYTIGFFAFAQSLGAGRIDLGLLGLAICGLGVGLSMSTSYTFAIAAPSEAAQERVVGLVQTIRRMAVAVLIVAISNTQFGRSQKATALAQLDLLVWFGAATTVLIWLFCIHQIWARPQSVENADPKR